MLVQSRSLIITNITPYRVPYYDYTIKEPKNSNIKAPTLGQIRTLRKAPTLAQEPLLSNCIQGLFWRLPRPSKIP